jgi:hypothetical protein
MAGMDELYSGSSPPMSRQRLTQGGQWSTATSTPMMEDSAATALSSPSRRRQREPEAQPAGDAERYVSLGLGLSGLVCENLLAHPFVVVRRQCQVNMMSVRTHATPFTLLPIVVTLHRWQGATSMWKGLGSTLMVKGSVRRDRS